MPLGVAVGLINLIDVREFTHNDLDAAMMEEVPEQRRDRRGSGNFARCVAIDILPALKEHAMQNLVKYHRHY